MYKIPTTLNYYQLFISCPSVNGVSDFFLYSIYFNNLVCIFIPVVNSEYESWNHFLNLTSPSYNFWARVYTRTLKKKPANQNTLLNAYFWTILEYEYDNFARYLYLRREWCLRFSFWFCLSIISQLFKLPVPLFYFCQIPEAHRAH